MSGLKEVARVAKGVAEGLLRVADVFQMCRQIIDEFERGEFPLHLHLSHEDPARSVGRSSNCARASRPSLL
jgi:hypothetical protein